jgi:hypothetical protein
MGRQRKNTQKQIWLLNPRDLSHHDQLTWVGRNAHNATTIVRVEHKRVMVVHVQMRRLQKRANRIMKRKRVRLRLRRLVHLHDSPERHRQRKPEGLVSAHRYPAFETGCAQKEESERCIDGSSSLSCKMTLAANKYSSTLSMCHAHWMKESVCGGRDQQNARCERNAPRSET